MMRDIASFHISLYHEMKSQIKLGRGERDGMNTQVQAIAQCKDNLECGVAGSRKESTYLSIQEGAPHQPGLLSRGRDSACLGV
jgi:hypothetical protein